MKIAHWHLSQSELPGQNLGQSTFSSQRCSWGRSQHAAFVLVLIVLSMQPSRLAAQPSSVADFEAIAKILTNSADYIERENELTKARRLGTNAYPLVPALMVVVSTQTNQHEREMATEVIAAIGRRAKEATLSLARIVEDKIEHPRLRTKATRAIGHIGSEAAVAVPTLILLLDPTNSPPLLRIEAVVALGKLGPVARQSIPKLLVLLRSNDREETELVTQVAKTLGAFSHYARDALKPLSRKFSDHMVDIDVFQASMWAFMQIFEETWKNPDRTDSDLLLLHEYGRVVEGRFFELGYPECRAAAERLRDLNSKIADQLANTNAASPRERWWTQLPWYGWVVGIYWLLFFTITPQLLKRRPLWIFRANGFLGKLPEVPVPGIPGVKIGLRFALGFQSIYGHPRVLDAWIDRHYTSLESHFQPPPRLAQPIIDARQKCMELINRASVVRECLSNASPELLANALGPALLPQKVVSLVFSPTHLDPATSGSLVPLVGERLRVIAEVEDGEKWLPQDFLKILLQKKRIIVVLAGFESSCWRIQQLGQSPDGSSVNALIAICRP